MHYAYYETYIDIFPVFAYSLNIHSFGYNHCISLLFNGQVKPKALFGDKLCGLRLRGSFMCEELCLPVCRVLFGYKLHISNILVWKASVNLSRQRVVVCLKADWLFVYTQIHLLFGPLWVTGPVCRCRQAHV